MGMKLIYLEAGSGAAQAVPTEMVASVADTVNIPIVVGGGLRTPEDCASRIEGGADFVVMGNSFEGDMEFRRLREVAAACHPAETIRV
jgi:putative glycerol-1-phosphate prenyltransferase